MVGLLVERDVIVLIQGVVNIKISLYGLSLCYLLFPFFVSHASEAKSLFSHAHLDVTQALNLRVIKRSRSANQNAEKKD